MSDLFDTIPGLREAVEREREIRDGSFLGAPEFICGIEVEPFTLSHFIRLDAVGSPFLCGGLPTAADVALFLWAVSPAYARAIRWRQWLGRWVLWLIRWRFVSRLRRLSPTEVVAGIARYVDDALQDAPRAGVERSKSYWSAWAGTVCVLASETGWSENEILRLPCKRLFQYLKVVRKMRDPDAILFNTSDGVVSRWLERNGRKAEDGTR